ncbi:putative cyclohexadienyl dehydratase signal peptide protein, partial [Vibrio parahaemolyticus V-223/04]
SCSEPSSRNSG